MSTDTDDNNADKNKVVNFNQAKDVHVFERKERKLKALKKAFASYIAPDPGLKKKKIKKTKKSKKK